jgi:hypothetical protein
MTKSLTINRQREQLNILVFGFIDFYAYRYLFFFFALQLSSSHCNMSSSLVGMNVNQINLENESLSDFLKFVFILLSSTQEFSAGPSEFLADLHFFLVKLF